MPCEGSSCTASDRAKGTSPCLFAVAQRRIRVSIIVYVLISGKGVPPPLPSPVPSVVPSIARRLASPLRRSCPPTCIAPPEDGSGAPHPLPRLKNTPRTCPRGAVLWIQLCRVRWDGEPSPVPFPFPPAPVLPPAGEAPPVRTLGVMRENLPPTGRSRTARLCPFAVGAAALGSPPSPSSRHPERAPASRRISPPAQIGFTCDARTEWTPSRFFVGFASSE